jgi:hypothetical protein
LSVEQRQGLKAIERPFQLASAGSHVIRQPADHFERNIKAALPRPFAQKLSPAERGQRFQPDDKSRRESTRQTSWQMRQLAGAVRCGQDRLPTPSPALVERSDHRFDAMNPQSMNVLDDQQVAIAGHDLILSPALVGRDDANYQVGPALNSLGGEGIDEVGLAGADGTVQQQRV